MPPTHRRPATVIRPFDGLHQLYLLPTSNITVVLGHVQLPSLTPQTRPSASTLAIKSSALVAVARWGARASARSTLVRPLGSPTWNTSRVTPARSAART